MQAGWSPTRRIRHGPRALAPEAAAPAGEVTLLWTNATADLVRLFEHLSPVAPKAAAHAVRRLTMHPTG